MKTLQDQIESLELLNTNNPLILAISGGVDSMVLLDVFQKLDKNIVIAHVNHKKRQASNHEYDYIKSYAQQHNIPFEGYVLNEEIIGNFQAQARKKRRIFFLSVAKKYKTDKIILAHHADDQLETFFMRIVNGYALESLIGMTHVQADNNMFFIRPFLTIKKSQLINYAKTHNIFYFEDLSNKSMDYTRNRFRHDIIPTLLKENPNLHQAIDSYSKQFTAYKSLTATLANDFLETQSSKINLSDFLDLNLLIQQAVLNHCLYKLIKDKHSISQGVINTLLDLLKNTKNNFVHPITKNINLHKEYNTFFIAKSMQNTPISITIKRTGLYQVDTDNQYYVTEENLTHKYSNYHVIWYNDKVFPIYIRNRKDGDKITLAFGTKKIKSLFIDKKIPPSHRDDILLFANDEEILWIPFLKIGNHTNKEFAHKLYLYEV